MCYVYRAISEKTFQFYTQFHRLTLSCLSVPLIRGRNKRENESLKTESIVLALYVGKKLQNWGIDEDFDA
jgi:hypothetical protein